MDHAVEHSTNGSSGHEHREANLRLILYAAAGLAVTVAIVFVLMWGSFNLLKTDEEKNREALSPMAPMVQTPPEPRLEEHPWESLQELRTRENHLLTTYGWQDQKAGIVRIPVERAIDMVAQKGLPYEGGPGVPAPKPAAAAKPPVAKPPAGAPNAER